MQHLVSEWASEWVSEWASNPASALTSAIIHVEFYCTLEATYGQRFGWLWNEGRLYEREIWSEIYSDRAAQTAFVLQAGWGGRTKKEVADSGIKVHPVGEAEWSWQVVQGDWLIISKLISLAVRENEQQGKTRCMGGSECRNVDRQLFYFGSTLPISSCLVCISVLLASILYWSLPVDVRLQTSMERWLTNQKHVKYSWSIMVEREESSTGGEPGRKRKETGGTWADLSRWRIKTFVHRSVDDPFCPTGWAADTHTIFILLLCLVIWVSEGVNSWKQVQAFCRGLL